MKFVQEFRRAVAWVATVLRAFFHIRPGTTLSLIMTVTVSQICTLLAFFLPLKVILLAGSDGVPRYFRSFIDPQHKLSWIVVLSVGAVVLYASSLVLTVVSQRIAETGSTEILRAANELAVASRQREEAQDYYSTFATIAANALLSILGLVTLALIHPLLLAALSGLILVGFLATAWAFQRDSPLDPSPAQTRIRENLSDYLKIFTSTGILLGFLVILVPFLLGWSSNLLLAILSLLIVRQAVRALARGVKDTVSLWAKRPQIDPLLFRERQLHRPEPPFSRSLRQVFAKAEREHAASEALTRAGLRVDELSSEWRDNRIRDVYTFVLRARPSGNGQPRLFQQQVFAGAQRSLLEHEEFLFSHCDRALLRAPTVVARYDIGQFATQICDYGTGERYPPKRWSEVSAAVVTYYWALQPPSALVTAYRTSHPSLQARLSTELLEHLTVALDGSPDTVHFERFMSALPALRSVLDDIPLYIHNPDLIRYSVVMSPRREPLVMQWCRWAIEPIGDTLPTSISDDVLVDAVEAVRRVRGIADGDLTLAHVRLVNECSALERSLLQRHYRRALEHIPRILKNALVKGGS